MKTLFLLRLAAGFAATAIFAQAHALWVGSSRYLLEHPGKSSGAMKTTLYTGWGHRLPVDETVAPERFGGIQLISPDGRKLDTRAAADGYHATTVEIDRPGVWLAITANKPGFSTQVRDADGNISYLPVPKNEVPAGRKIAESNYIKTFGKTVIHVQGSGATEGALSRPVGHELEIVPLRNPASAKPGDTLPVQILFKGTPYQGEPIELVAEHVAAPYVGQAGKWNGETDARGKVHVPVGLPGVWMLLVTVFDPATGELAARADQTRLRATLTFEIPGTPGMY